MTNDLKYEFLTTVPVRTLKVMLQGFSDTVTNNVRTLFGNINRMEVSDDRYQEDRKSVV